VPFRKADVEGGRQLFAVVMQAVVLRLFCACQRFAAKAKAVETLLVKKKAWSA